MRIGENFLASIVQVEISEEMRQRADAMARELGVLRNSITHGQSNIFGKMGELVAHSVLGGHYIDDRDADIVLADGRAADVKSKGRAVPPQPHFDCTVSAFNTQQMCDLYVFTSVLKDLSKGWVLGWYPKKQFYLDSRFFKAGDYDERNRWTCKADSFSITCDQLYPVSSL